MPEHLPPLVVSPRKKIPLAVKIALIGVALGIVPTVVGGTLLAYSFRAKLAAVAGGTVTAKTASSAALAETTIFAFVVLLLSIAAIIIALHIVVSPVSNIRDIIKRLAQGRKIMHVGTPTNDEYGEVLGLIDYLVRRLAESREREELVNRAKTEFISIAAHQLRTPLSSTKWVMRMMLDGDVGSITEDQRQLLQKGYAANENMIELIRDLLDASRIEEGRFGYTFELTDIKKLIKKTIEDLRPAADAKQLTLTVEFPGELPKPLIDPQRMGLVIQNLVSNAINYTPQHGTIRVRALQEENNVKISVQDSGVGIPKEELSRIFVKFFRGANVVRMQTEGSGLGLFIVKNIVLRHGGDISMESQEGVGSTFTVTLPIQLRHVPAQERPFLEPGVM